MKVASSATNTGAFIDTAMTANNTNCSQDVVFKAGGETSVQEWNKKGNSLKLYPNPATDRLYIPYEKEQSGQAVLLVMDISGRVLQQMEFASVVKGSNLQLDVNSLGKGVYLVALITDHRRSIGKFVKN